MISQIWADLAEYHVVIVSTAITLLLAGITALLRPKVKLIWGQANNSYHLLKGEKSNDAVYCEKHYLQNLGRKTAIGVEFIYHHAPTEVSVWQARAYDKKLTPEGQFMITIPQIAPKELVIIDSIYVNKVQADIVSVKNGDSIGRGVNFVVNRRLSKWFLALLWALLFMGAVSLVSLVIRFIIQVYTK